MRFSLSDAGDAGCFVSLKCRDATNYYGRPLQFMKFDEKWALLICS